MPKETTRVVQLKHTRNDRAIALVQEPFLMLLEGFTTVYDLAKTAHANGQSVVSLVKSLKTVASLPYDGVYNGDSEWKLLPSFDHPTNPFACLVTGTGLTHNSSALNRQAMHQAETNTLTDSMRMYQWGVEGGRPENGEVGVQPEWFYKGTGHTIRAHGQALEIQAFADDGGEEPEVAGVYFIDDHQTPCRIGFTIGNEFSDHVMERKNYLYLAPSKLRTCSIGPELVLDHDLSSTIRGNVSIKRNSSVIWSKDIQTGEGHMAHSIANLEHHHFKYPIHRIEGQAHIHFYGADGFSFGDKLFLEDSDVMEIKWEGFGRPLRNYIAKDNSTQTLIKVKRLE